VVIEIRTFNQQVGTQRSKATRRATAPVGVDSGFTLKFKKKRKGSSNNEDQGQLTALQSEG